jgi:hypothetical protein
LDRSAAEGKTSGLEISAVEGVLVLPLGLGRLGLELLLGRRHRVM